jgi:hypothetical protein
MTDVTPEDALQVAQRALAKVNDLERELEALQADHDEAVEELTAARLRLSSHDEERTYDQLTRDDKIGMVREHAFERATDAGGRTAIDYSDVKWGVFDGGPSASHCYDLLRWAAGGGESTPDEQQDITAGIEGFAVRDPDDGNMQLVVDVDRAKSARDLLAAKKRPGREGVN